MASARSRGVRRDSAPRASFKQSQRIRRPLATLPLALALLLLLASGVAGKAGDADDDGVPDTLDACPGSTRGSRDHVDSNGCEWDQIDVDLDGWCNPDRPRRHGRWLPTRDDWCTGLDNCKHIPNPDQRRTIDGYGNYTRPSSRGFIGDACNPGGG